MYIDRQRVTCPHCWGTGEEDVAWADEFGAPICTLCCGVGEVLRFIAEKYEHSNGKR